MFVKKKNYYLHKCPKHSYHIEEDLDCYTRRLAQKQINLFLRPGGEGQNVLLSKQNRSFFSLQLSQLHMIGYIPCAQEPLPRQSGLEWIPSPVHSCYRKRLSQLTARMSLGIICYIQGMNADCPYAQWKTHHNILGSVDSTFLNLSHILWCM